MTARVDKETMDAVIGHVRRRGHIVVDTVPGAVAGLEGCGFHVVAWCEPTDEMAFIRVIHGSSNQAARVAVVRALRPTVEGMRKARRAAWKWCRDRHIDWKGAVRFDRIEVYGEKRRVFDWTWNVKGKL